MGSITLDDTFPENPKVRKVGPVGIALYVSGLCYSSRQLSDGFIPDNAVGLLCEMAGVKARRATIEALTKATLWKRVRGGYSVPDYLKFNDSREEITRKREENRIRQAAFRNARRNAVTNGGSNDPQLVSVVVSGLEDLKDTDQLAEYPKIAERLGTERYYAFQKFMRLVKGGDQGTPGVLAALCKKLPASEIDDVRMAYTKRGSVPVGKAVNALKQRSLEYETAMKRSSA